FVYGVSVGHVNAGFFQCRSSVRELVLDYQVLRLLSVYERSDIGSLGSDHRSDILNACFLQLCAYRIRRSWSDLVDHGPWEGNLILIGQVLYEAFLYEA